MDCQYPPVFKGFFFHFGKSLTTDDRGAFKLWCKGVVPDSKREDKMASVSDIFSWIDFLLTDAVLSVTKTSWIEDFLSSVGRHDLLEALNEVKLQISLGSILKDYVKSVRNDLRDDALKPSCNRSANVVKFLLATKERNKELIRGRVSNHLEQVTAYSISILENMNNSIPEISQPSWRKVTTYLVVIGEFFVSLCQPHTQLPDVAGLFSNTEACKVLSKWMLENGGLEAFQGYIEKEETTIGRYVITIIRESLKEDIELLGSRSRCSERSLSSAEVKDDPNGVMAFADNA
ncbi:uncharacterized protein LOC111342246 [Stylophora pistillata]|nr:uncharacterized protein LOC111342246 [Stylophora pistillata]